MRINTCHAAKHLNSVTENTFHSSALFNPQLVAPQFYGENFCYFIEEGPELITHSEQNTSIFRIIGSSKSYYGTEMNWLIPTYKALKSFCSSQRVWEEEKEA